VRRKLLTSGLIASAFVICCVLAVQGEPVKIDMLRIGTSGTLNPEGKDANDKSSLDTLRSFVKDETQLNSEIIRENDWQDLADKMSKRDLHVGVFQGFEFARAREKYNKLQPLAVAVNVYTYPVVYVVTRRKDQASDFKGLQGQSLALVSNAPGYLKFYVDRQCDAAGKKPDAFFSKIVYRDNSEDAIDDVVDGVIDATVADRATLDSYKRRKPARFNRLKSIAESKPFPPAVVACFDGVLDEATIKQFRNGLLDAANKEKGQTMLNLFRLTGFILPPADFNEHLAASLKDYPPENNGKAK
jgi:ABC-type phosphate/phosphonate transport system substrate-binding protein